MVKKPQARLNVYIDPDVHEKVKEWSEKSGTSISHLINTLLKSLFDEKIRDSTLEAFSQDYSAMLVDSLYSGMKASHKKDINIDEFKTLLAKEFEKEKNRIKEEVKQEVMKELGKKKT